MKWMEPFLASGQLAGKIICPNKKCSAKLGNYDWAGVCCGCKEWVTPVCSPSSDYFYVGQSSNRAFASIGPKLTRSFEMAFIPSFV